MKLYFKAGKTRLAINTDTKTYNNSYFYLGGYKDYMKISVTQLNDIFDDLKRENWKYDEKF